MLKLLKGRILKYYAQKYYERAYLKHDRLFKSAKSQRDEAQNLTKGNALTELLNTLALSYGVFFASFIASYAEGGQLEGDIKKIDALLGKPKFLTLIKELQK